jgi:hypothetical protein
MYIADDFSFHVDQEVPCGAHRPMEHILGFTIGHLMLPLGKCMRRIFPAAAIIDEFVVKHKTLPKNYFC